MIIIKINKHIEINESYQNIDLTEFTVNVDGLTTNDQIVETFIHSKKLSFDNLPDCVKNNLNERYLRQIFDIDKLKITDFKKTNKQGVLKFLIDFINEPNWGEDRSEFSKLLGIYIEIHNRFEDNEFYILSKDWFDEKDEILAKSESWMYIYYFLIILVEKKLNLLTLVEWTYD